MSADQAIEVQPDRRQALGSPAEALAELDRLARGLARGKRAGIPPELLARHVLAVYGTATWPVQRAALEALQRRIGFAERDGLRIAERPSPGPFGSYRTRRPGTKARPYRTVLEALAPFHGSCDCPDFGRASLGLCKHLLVVLADLGSRPRVLQRALEADAPGVSTPRAVELAWDPIRPLGSGAGALDWMERITLAGGPRARAGSQAAALARRFTRGEAGPARLRDTFPADPRRRLELVEALSAFLRSRRGGKTSAPALAARLEDERERLVRLTALRRAAPKLARALRSLDKGLYPYQVEGVKRFFSEGRLLLADDMGLGKTAQAIGACHALFGAGLIDRGLILMPASLKHQWQREWESFSSAPIAVVEGSPAERAEIYRRCRRGFLIANYEQVLRDSECMQRWRPGLVVLDEAQRIKNWATKLAHGVKRLQPSYRLVLTGTPMENRLEELASIFDWVDDHALEPKWRLVPFHAEYADGGRTLVGVRHLDVLRGRMAHCTVRRVRSDILKQLPPRTDTRLPVPLTPEQLEQHDELRRPISALLSRVKRRGLTRPEFLRLMQLLNTQRIIANGLAQLDFTSVWPSIRSRKPTPRLMRSLFSPKLIELRELLDQLVLQQGRKVVVFSQWRRMLTLARWAAGDLLAEAGLQSRFFTGAESARRRTHNLIDFHDDPDTAVLFASDAGGVGLNLQRAANACIHLELPWNPAVFEQRVARIHRLGQPDPIDVHALIGAQSIEERIARLVSDKRELFSGLFDGRGDAVRFTSAGSFLDGLATQLEAGQPPSRGTPAEPDDDDLPTTDEDLEELVQTADESNDPQPAPPAATDVRALFAQIEIERTPEGGLRIEAPPEAAASLAELLTGLAGLMSQAAGPRSGRA